MKKDRLSIKKIFSIDRVVLAIGSLLLALFLVMELILLLSDRIVMSPVKRSAILMLICVILYCGARLTHIKSKNPVVIRRLLILFFVLYLYFLISITLLDKSLGRDTAKYHLINFIPFHTIYQIYIVGYLRGWLNLYYVLLNLLGNLLALMPMAILLPLLFKRMQKWYLFLPTVILTVISIEGLQFLFWVGSTDIDDLILNTCGAMMMYGIIHIPFVKRIINRLLCEEILQ